MSLNDRLEKRYKMRTKRLYGVLLSVVMIIMSVIPSNYSLVYAATEDTVAEETVTGAAIKEEKKEETDKVNAVSDSAVTVTTEGAVDATAELRLIYTTDIHGQVTNYDYQNNETIPRGLNKVYTLIKQARSEKPEGYLTFDMGDALVDYTSEYIQAQSESTIQPVYQAMAKMGYDAITIGNHEFDYGYDYLIEQLEGSGLIDKSVLSNVTSKVNGKHVLGKERKIIEKKVIDSEGNERTIKVGIFGVTPPCMSSKTEGLRANVVSEDMLVVAEREAKALKEEGADIVVALAHTGFGTENPASRTSNTGYAMTKIEDIDVILGGHQHVYYPDSSEQKFYNYPNVDKETGLVNGKRFMILKNAARAIGVVDLDFEIDAEGKVVYTGSDYEIRKTTSHTAADDEITACLSAWDQKLREYSGSLIGKLPENDRWTNYTALLEDNEIIQTVQDAEMEYAANAIAKNAPEYLDYPILSMVRYANYGSASGSDFSDISNNIYKGGLANFGPYNCHMYIYEVTGKQLKEWLEWGASTYETVNSSNAMEWDDMTVSQYISNGKGNALIQSQYQNNWKCLFVFNGIEYNINPSQKPRYNADGSKINDTERVTSLTYNGIPVTEDQKFALCTEQIIVALDTEATKGVKSSVIYGSYNTLQDIVCEYLDQKANIGDIRVNVDSNWNVTLPENYSFIYTAGNDSQSIMEKKSWYDEYLSMSGDYKYYDCTYHSKDYSGDNTGPNVVVSSLNKEDTNDSVTYRLLCNDKSGINKKLYAKGQYSKLDNVWTTTGGAVSEIENDTIVVTGSGIYSVYVEDNRGNVTVEQFAVTNIYPSTLLAPTVNKVTNKMTSVKGTGEPNATVHVKSGNKEYKGTVALDGNFSVTIPLQNAGSTLSIYLTDKYGRSSGKKTVTVKRNGPNGPTVSTVKNTGTTITGKCNDKNVSIYAVIGQNVYVSKSLGSSYYKNSKGYKKELKIKLVNITIKSTGAYTISIPNQYAGTVVKVYSIDKVGRVSGARKATVSQTAPNRVSIRLCTTAEQYVYGYIPKGNSCTVAVKNGSGRTYYGTADKNGYFAVRAGTLKSGTTMTVRAKGKNGVYSYPATIKVTAVSSVFEKYNKNVKVNRVTDKSTEIKGTSKQKNSSIYIYASDGCHVAKVNSKGEFFAKIKTKQKVDFCIYAVSRNNNGVLNGIYRTTVKLGKPITPKITSKIKVKTKKIVVEVKEDCKVSLKIDKKKYTKYKVKYIKSKKVYQCTFTVKKIKAKQKITAYATNAAGTSKGKTLKVKKSVKK